MRCRSLSYPYDASLSRMLIVYIATGVAFMVLPGTLVGVMNLLTISASHTARAADAGWVQAHGHAQIFGWLGTFILGIGYYAIPRLRLSRFAPGAAWSTYVLWTLGVTMRWAVGTWPWHWRELFPVAGALEFTAVAIFCASVYIDAPHTSETTWRTSVSIIATAGWAMLLATGVGAAESFIVSRTASAPVFPFDFNQRYLVLISWGFIVPFIWGFSTRWLPPLLGLRKTYKRGFVPAVVILYLGVGAALGGWLLASSIILTVASIVFIVSIRLLEPSEKEPKLRGVHPLTPMFLRIAQAWLLVAGVIAIAAAAHPLPNGYAGASRHALTVGFFSAMVFAVGPRVLPAFFGVARVWSARAMAIALTLLNVGCVIRVVSQILAYEQISAFAWRTLPLSAVIEMTAIALFAANMMMTLTTGSPVEEAFS